MAVELGHLSEEDRSDFERRLAIFGLDASAVEPELRVRPNSRVNLAYGPNRDSYLRPIVREVTDFDELNRMIGIDDRVFEKAPPLARLPRMLSWQAEQGGGRFTVGPGYTDVGMARREEALAHLDIKRMPSEDLATIRDAARAYLYGDSKLVAHFKPLLESVIGPVILPIWAVENVYVPSGSTLTFGPGVNSLIAYQVEIEEGGRIVSYGHLNVSCTIIRKVAPPVVHPPLPRPRVKRSIFWNPETEGEIHG